MYIKILLIGALLPINFAVSAPKIIYGRDNRTDLIDMKNYKIHVLGKAIAGRVKNRSIDIRRTRAAILGSQPLSNPFAGGLCKDERFADQPSASDCTGFLVGEDLLVTAGHCATGFGTKVENEVTLECESHSWLFDYKINRNGEANVEDVKVENIYGCKEIVIADFSPTSDFALIRLERKASADRVPLKMNLKEKVKVGESIFVMGHPSGLPLKYAGGAEVFSQEEANYFSTNLDTFGGNSGSPVFNSRTMEVEGILVRGDIDYVVDEFEGERCRRVNVCDASRENCIKDDPNIDGEHVTNIQVLKSYLKD